MWVTIRMESLMGRGSSLATMEVNMKEVLSRERLRVKEFK